jgi:hypothetical protein
MNNGQMCNKTIFNEFRILRKASAPLFELYKTSPHGNAGENSASVRAQHE